MNGDEELLLPAVDLDGNRTSAIRVGEALLCGPVVSFPAGTFEQRLLDSFAGDGLLVEEDRVSLALGFLNGVDLHFPLLTVTLRIGTEREHAGDFLGRP